MPFTERPLALVELRRRFMKRLAIIGGIIGGVICITYAVLILSGAFKDDRQAFLESCCANNARDIVVLGENLRQSDHDAQVAAIVLKDLRSEVDTLSIAQGRLRDELAYLTKTIITVKPIQKVKP